MASSLWSARGASGGLRLGGRPARRMGVLLSYLVLGLGSMFFLFPLYWQLSTSLKTWQDAQRYPPLWLPWPPQWSNYAELVQRFPFALYLRNSAFIVTLVILGVLLSSSLAAYGFARLRMPGRDTIFLILLSTLMLPGAVLIIPQFVLFQSLHWVNTYKPLIVPSFFGNPFSIFLLRQFLLSIPVDLEDAARIDGAGYLRTYAQIILPLARPALLAVAIYTFLGTWNDFVGPLLYIKSPDLFTVSIGLAGFRSIMRSRWDLLIAASTAMTVPVIALFFAAQRYFFESGGITLTGLK